MKKIIALSLLLLLLITACQRKVEPIKGEPGGRLVIGTTDLPVSLSPLTPSVFGSNDLMNLIFMPLHKIDPVTGKMQPELARSWEFSEDLTAITYYLRADVTWWDGTPVTAEDVVFTCERMKDPATNYPNAASLRFLKDVQVVGPNAVRFTFDRVYADLLMDSDIMPLPKHIFEKVGADKFGSQPVGNGPYKVKEFVPGLFLTLTSNEAYYRGRPPLDEIQIRYYARVDDLKNDFNQGVLDIALNLNPAVAQELAANKNVTIDSRPGAAYTYVGWNLNNPLLTNQEFRHALTMAINRPRILSDIYQGMGTLSLGPLPPTSWGFDVSVAPLEYNLNKAREILRNQGLVDRNNNGYLEQNNRDITLTIITNSENTERVKILNQVTDDLKNIGIKVNARVMRVDSFIAAVVGRQFDGFIMGWSVGDKIDPAPYWYSDPDRGRFNFSSYKNKRVDSLIDAGAAMLNRKRAREIWSEFQKIIYEDQPYTFLIVPNEISALYKRVKGAEGGIQLASVYTYWIPEAERRIAVAATTPAVTPTTAAPTPSPTPTSASTAPVKPAETTPKPPPVVTAPERILEAAAKKETTAVATTPPVTPPPTVTPPKASVITQAKVIKQVVARYPESARALNATGVVKVKITIGTDGKVKTAVVSSSFGNPACEEAALVAARQWEFEPAKKDGVPFEQTIQVPFSFSP